MPLHRSLTTAGIAVALLAPATAAAQPNPDNRSVAPTSSLAGTTSPQNLQSPDAADVTRAGVIAASLRDYQPSQPLVAAATATPAPAPSDTPDWPPIAFGAVVLALAGGQLVRVRLRSRRVAA